MKKRQGFVSNSSSSSFIVGLKDLTPLQRLLLPMYERLAKRAWRVDCVDSWTIVLEMFLIRGVTVMDNGDMVDFMNQIGIPQQKVRWETSGW